MVANKQPQLKISIAMATYNGAKYLQEQLDSFLAQTRQPDELVITDDCSTDETAQIVERFAAMAPFDVRWKRNERNLGYAGNFNEALLKTTGDLVFLSDQDDVWFSDKLQIMEQYAHRFPEDLVLMNDAALTDAKLHDTGLTKIGQIRAAGLTTANFVMGCCTTVRRELFDLCLPIPTSYPAHDSWIVKMADGMGRKRVVSDILQWYRRHETNESQVLANSTEKITRVTVLKHKLQKKLRSSNCKEQAQQSYLEMQHFLDGVRRAQIRAPHPFNDELKVLSNQLMWQLSAMENRFAVRRKSRAQRLPSVVRLWRSGGYREFAGIKSAVRDIILR